MDEKEAAMVAEMIELLWRSRDVFEGQRIKLADDIEDFFVRYQIKRTGNRP